MLQNWPEDAPRIRRALITLLQRENKRTMTEDEATFHGDLISSVGALRDPNAVDALMGAVRTGGIVRSALVQIAPASTPKLLAMAQQDTSLNNRHAARIVLGQIAKRHPEVVLGKELTSAILESLLRGLDENDDIARGASISALGAFPDNPRARMKIARLAQEDTTTLVKPDGTVWIPARERAASWLLTHSKPR